MEVIQLSSFIRPRRLILSLSTARRQDSCREPNHIYPQSEDNSELYLSSSLPISLLLVYRGMLYTTLLSILRLQFELLLAHICNTHLGRTVAVQHLLVEEIDIDGIHHRQDIADDGYHHSQVRIVVGDDGAGGRREHHAAGNGCYKARAPQFGMAAETAQAEGEDGGEARRLEKEHNDQHGDGDIAAGGDGCDGEDDTHGQVQAEHIARFEGGDHEQEARQESVEGVHALAHGEHVGAKGRGVTGLFDKVDEVVGDADLAANVAELGPDGEEEVGLFAKGADIVVADGVFLDAPIFGRKETGRISSGIKHRGVLEIKRRQNAAQGWDAKDGRTYQRR